MLSAFVEKERGLKFKSPVTVTVLEDGPFKTSLAERRMARLRRRPARRRA